MKKYIFGLALSLTAQWGFAQHAHPSCGTSVADQAQFTDRLRENVANAEKLTPADFALQYVPLHFHLVGDQSGNGKHRASRVLDQLCDLNAQYEALEMRFYISPHPTFGIFDSTLNLDNVYSSQAGAFSMNSKRHPNALNIYIVDKADGDDGVLAYYSPARDWVVAEKAYVKGNGEGKQVLPHEVGHFFSLAHTFYGYEPNPFDGYVGSGFPNDATWPTAPTVSPGGIPTERVNGSNCMTSGDYICDTPPDYNFGFSPYDDGTCTYKGGINGVFPKDPQGAVVNNPMENNLMGYFFGCSSYEFTAQQRTAILADRNQSSRNYLDNNFTPIATEIITPTDLLTSPANNATTQNYDFQVFEWQAVPGAKWYLIEFDISSSYNTGFYQGFISTSPSVTVKTLAANRTYFWRVRPFNEYVTCAASRQRTVKTNNVSVTNIREVEGLSNWQVMPNPAERGATIFMSMELENAMDATLRVFDVYGREMYRQNKQSFNAGLNTMEVPTAQLSAGVYFISLENGTGQSVKRIAIN